MPQTTSKEAAVQSLLGAFRDRGFDGASLAELSKASGLGKSSLYHHFPGGKDDMAQTVLEHVTVWMHENVIEPLSGSEPPQERLERMIAALDDFYEGGRKACVLGNFVLGGARDRFGGSLRASFESWISAITQLGVDAGVGAEMARSNAEDAVVQIQGALILAAGLKNQEPFGRMLKQLPALLMPHSST